MTIRYMANQARTAGGAPGYDGSIQEANTLMISAHLAMACRTMRATLSEVSSVSGSFIMSSEELMGPLACRIGCQQTPALRRVRLLNISRVALEKEW